LSRNLGTVTSWNPLGHYWPVTALIYIFKFYIPSDWNERNDRRMIESPAICVYHEIGPSDQSKKNKIRGVLEREKKITTKSWLGSLEKREKKTMEDTSNIYQ